VAFLAAASGVLTARPVLAEDWDSEGFLYGWFYGVDGTVAAGDAVSGFPVEASVDDISNFKDFSMAVHFEAKTSKAILLGDVQYLNLGAERDFELPSGFTRGELDFQHWTFEAGGGYRVSEKFDLLGVGRLYELSTGSTLGSNTISDKRRSWMDVFVGGRYTVSSGKLRASVRADIGTGGSDFAWFANAMIGYRVSERMTLGLGYRILSVDYETGENANYFRYDVVQDGLGLALGLDF
jgi:hypothetical protein